ncbi:MAG: efflux RND transporter periplasmic adaptor subunit [Bordetella sp.]|uniref:efflux RND transporter periplasmic adaptor subunit n=1 Tax=Bordetella sp. TaxID=28081 RepID=UPI003F7BAB90
MSKLSPPPIQRSRRGAIVLTVIVVVLIAAVASHLIGKKAPQRAAPAQVVSVAQAVTGDMPEIMNELGTVTPVATVTVLPQLSGFLTEVGYQEGQEVQKGQFLAQIDPRQYQIGKQQAQAQLAKDQAALAQARSDLARYTQLFQQKSIAEQTYANQRFTVQQDEAAVQADRASIAQYDLDLDYCRITAPVSGRVGLRLVDPGNFVSTSTSTGIAVITTIKPTTVQFTVPQNSLARIIERFNSGDTLQVTAYNSDNTRKIAVGTLYAIGNQMSTSTGTVMLRARFANDDEALFPNEFVNVQLRVDTLKNAVLVPTPAVQTGAPGDYVYVVNANDTVTLTKVTPGPTDGSHTAILAGLKAGDKVVTDGMDRLSDGAQIRVAGAPPTAQQGGSKAKPHPAAGNAQ